MSDKQKVIVSLAIASETCIAALGSLSSSDLQSRLHEQKPPDLAILQRDLASLLTLIHAATTKCALTLKPSSPTYPAALVPLKDLSTNTAALIHCAQLFDGDVHGVTLTKEVVSTVKDVIEAIRALIQTFLAIQSNAGSGSGLAGEEYLVRTGEVHDLIDKAKSEKGIPKDNLGAIRKKWVEDRAALEDGFREVGEMVEEAEETEDEEDGIDDEDGWGELGLGKGRKMDVDELERTKKVHALLRLTTLLHKRILLDLLSPSTSLPTLQTTALDALLDQSTALLTASDDLVSTLYTPQDPSSVSTELTTFIDIVKALQSSLQFAFFPLESQFGDMSIQEAQKKPTKKDIRKWFETCFEQIYKSSTVLASTLNVDNTSHEAP